MTAYRYVRTGRLPATRGGALWLVDPSDLGAVATSAGAPGRHRAAGRITIAAALVRRLESRLVAGDEAGAWAIVAASWSGGTAPDTLVVDLIGAAMRLVGDRWATGDLTVDDEHQATGVAQRLFARLGPQFTTRGPKRRSVVLGAPPDELHGPPPWPPTSCAAAATRCSIWAPTSRSRPSPPPRQGDPSARGGGGGGVLR